MSVQVPNTHSSYQATHDPFYLDVGERILEDITARARVACGLTGIQDLRTNKRDDRMESFALSETLKVGFLDCFHFEYLTFYFSIFICYSMKTISYTVMIQTMFFQPKDTY